MTDATHDHDKVWLIAWASDLTGEEGIGTTPLTRAAADDWVQALNEKYPGVRHWAIRMKRSIQGEEPAND
jgi:hypothetical protein